MRLLSELCHSFPSLLVVPSWWLNSKWSLQHQEGEEVYAVERVHFRIYIYRSRWHYSCSSFYN
uniref:Uncharacterized protein n=1 Tax=Anguilla anguilla TaxID=7936 RepID=A0A0E9P6D1_ANGAN